MKFIYNISLIGDSYVGKTSLLHKYIYGKIPYITTTTIGLNFHFKKIVENNKEHIFRIWDTAGLERYQTIFIPYFKKTNAFIFIFDITNFQSFINLLKYWIPLAINSNLTADRYIVSTKNDNDAKKNIIQLINKACNKFNMKYYETSAKNGNNVENLFDNIFTNHIKNNSKIIEKLLD